MRLISLEGTPEGFAADVTRSNNTQNELNAVDFVSIDPTQDRIRKEAAQLGIVYAFRRGEAEPEKDRGFTVRAATIAAACASGDLKLAVASKRYISGLWENIRKEPYTKLFNERTTATYLWNAVRVMRTVDEFLDAEAENLTGRERLTAVHGNRFVLFNVFEAFNLESLRKSDFYDEATGKRCREIASDCLHKIIPVVNTSYPDSYPGNIFKNQDRQFEILQAIQAE